MFRVLPQGSTFFYSFYASERGMSETAAAAVSGFLFKKSEKLLSCLVFIPEKWYINHRMFIIRVFMFTMWNIWK